MKYMKIKCKNCGKSFHYEACNGICKYCGRYMGMRDVEEQRKRNETDKRQKANSKWTENQKILCTFLVGIMVIVFAVSVFRTRRQAAINTVSREVGIIEADTAAMQEDIFVAGGSLQILECGIVEEWKKQLPEGYDLIYIEYEAKEVRRYYTDVYLKLPQMAYVKPVSEYRLSDEVGIDVDILEEEYGICDELGMENGRILFLVPEEIKKADLAIYSYGESDVEKKENSTKILQAVYEIPVGWEAE